MTRPVLPLLIALLAFSNVAFVHPSRAEDRPACGALLLDDGNLLDSLPSGLRSIVKSARFRSLLTNRDSAWSKFYSALDRGLDRPGQDFVARVGDLEATMRFRRTWTGKVELWIDSLSKGGARDLTLGKNADGSRFLDFVAAELSWIAKARETGKLERGLTIYGRDLRNRRLIDLLESIGFRKSRWPGPRCYILGVAGGLAGYAGGRVFFAKFDSGDENGSIYEEQRKLYRDIAFGAAGGAGIAIASACFTKTGRNYSIEFDPDELPRPAKTIPDTPKAEPKPDPKVDPKPEPKVEPKPDPKVEPKPGPKVEPKSEPASGSS